MNSGNFVEVFNVARSGYRDWSFAAFGLIFVGIGGVLVFGPSLVRSVGIPFFRFNSGFGRFFGFFYLGFAILWTGFSFSVTYSSHLRHKDLAETNGCSVVEGPVENFVPMPYEGHADESFSVSGVRFSYSDYGITDGFNNTSSHGGPINANAYVRICYDPRDHTILRLAIRNFHGTIKNQSGFEDFFKETPPATPNARAPSAPHLPAPKYLWLGNIWMALWLADALAVVSLFLPYLRTFWRAGEIQTGRVPIPVWLPEGQKFKLRNTLAFWDGEHASIWLRPRGFNYLRLPTMVTELVTDDSGTAIVGADMRVSSGLPFIFAIFFISAYIFFSQTMPANAGAPPAALFVGFVVVVFSIGAVFSWNRTKSRKNELVMDALSELGEQKDLAT